MNGYFITDKIWVWVDTGKLVWTENTIVLGIQKSGDCTTEGQAELNGSGQSSLERCVRYCHFLHLCAFVFTFDFRVLRLKICPLLLFHSCFKNCVAGLI